MLPVLAHADTWQIDPAHTNVEFTVRHMMISNVKGQFQKTAGTITANGNDAASAQIDATIDASSVDTRVERRDMHLKSPDFLDVAKYPTITFKSTKVEADGPNKWKVTGDLTLHGVTKPVVLDVESSGRADFDDGQDACGRLGDDENQAQRFRPDVEQGARGGRRDGWRRGRDLDRRRGDQAIADFIGLHLTRAARYR